MSKKKKKLEIKINFWLLGVLLSIFLVSLVTNFFILNSTNRVLDGKIAEAKEIARPADIEIITLNAPDCDDCANIQMIIEAIKKENVNVISEERISFEDEKSNELIKKYNISKLPTFIIKGEIEKEKLLKDQWPVLGEVRDDTFIFRKNRPPYVVANTGEVKGRLDIKMITDRNCEGCFNVVNHMSILQRLGLPVNNQKVLEVGMDDGRAIVRKYDIQLLPTFIIEGDIEQYPDFQKIWPQVGTVENDGLYVMRDGVKNVGIYKNLKTGEIIDPREAVK